MDRRPTVRFLLPPPLFPMLSTPFELELYVSERKLSIQTPKLIFTLPSSFPLI